MFFKGKSSKKIDIEQHELLENAQKRIRQKKRLYYHFVIFLVGSIFLIVLNKVLNYWPDRDWFVWAILAWCFLLIIHFVNVFFTSKFMGQEWERSQREKLIARQKKKIAEIQSEIEKEYPLPDPKKNTGNE